MDKLGYIENFGTGIPRTMAAYKSFASKPEFHSGENFFVAIFPDVNYKADQINDQINDLGLEAFRIVQRNPGIKASGICQEMAKSGKVASLDSVRNVIKRNIRDCVELVGFRKTADTTSKGNPRRRNDRRMNAYQAGHIDPSLWSPASNSERNGPLNGASAPQIANKLLTIHPLFQYADAFLAVGSAAPIC